MLCFRQICKFHALKHVSICFSLPISPCSFSKWCSWTEKPWKGWTQTAGSLQKSEAKAREKVIYALYLVKPQCIHISERLFLKWQGVQKFTCSATGLPSNKRCSWIWAVHAMRTSPPLLIFWSWINPLRTLCLQRLLALHNDLTVLAPVSFIFCLFAQYFNGFDFVTLRHLESYSRWEQ